MSRTFDRLAATEEPISFGERLTINRALEELEHLLNRIDAAYPLIQQDYAFRLDQVVVDVVTGVCLGPITLDNITGTGTLTVQPTGTINFGAGSTLNVGPGANGVIYADVDGGQV